MLSFKKLALNKATNLAGHNICAGVGSEKRHYATSIVPQALQEKPNGRPRKKPSEYLHKGDRKKQVVANRDFLRSILESNATMREAKLYLKAFAPPSVSESPNFSQMKAKDRIDDLVDDPFLRIALVKVIAPQTFDEETLGGIGQTLFQLERLGLLSIVVLDCNIPEGQIDDGKSWRDIYVEQTGRMVASIDKHIRQGGRGARVVDSVVGVSEQINSETGLKSPKAHIMMRKLLMASLRKGIIPVLPSWGYESLGQAASPLYADDIVLALTRELTGLHSRIDPDEDPEVRALQIKSIREEASIERLIILDPKGGIPTSTRSNRYHVFINLEQEFEEIRQELSGSQDHAITVRSHPREEIKEWLERSSRSNPRVQFFETELGSHVKAPTKEIISPAGGNAFSTNASHVKNLELVRRVLSLLSPNASALLTTPEEAANKYKPDPFQAAGVSTRPLRNPLIHNLLTDKPAFSSSLPASRMGLNSTTAFPSNPAITRTPTTFAKRGMPVTIFPDPKTSPWRPSSPSHPSLNLLDPRIDLPRLVHLINDSFNRTLDVPRYLERIKNRVAGVIIAGEYEGGALLTWELPPDVPDDGSPSSQAQMVPYLDKFAVLKKSQGTGGVADIVFSAMVRDCFPTGVVWRSRKDNPVNKWYFERSRGTRKLSDSNWTMFWTGGDDGDDERVLGEGGRIRDYEAVCRAIEPTWADGKSVVD